MKIEAGKYYKTRSGRRAYVISTGGSPFDSEFPIVGYIEGEAGEFKGVPTGWQLPGGSDGDAFFYPPGSGVSDDDLVDEWTEPQGEQECEDMLVLNGQRYRLVPLDD